MCRYSMQQETYLFFLKICQTARLHLPLLVEDVLSKYSSTLQNPSQLSWSLKYLIGFKNWRCHLVLFTWSCRSYLRSSSNMTFVSVIIQQSKRHEGLYSERGIGTVPIISFMFALSRPRRLVTICWLPTIPSCTAGISAAVSAVYD